MAQVPIQPCAIVDAKTCHDDIVSDGYKYEFRSNVGDSEFKFGELEIDLGYRAECRHNILICDTYYTVKGGKLSKARLPADEARLVVVKWNPTKKDDDSDDPPITIIGIDVYNHKKLLMAIPCDTVVDMQACGPFVVTQTNKGKHLYYNIYP